MRKAWQQINIKTPYHCKNQVQKLKVKTQKEDSHDWVCVNKHNKIECVFKHNTSLKNLLFKINIHTIKDQNHIV